MKIVTKLVLIGLLTTCSLNAKELFDLRIQDFSNTLEDKQIDSRYKINESIIVETNTLKERKGGYYYTTPSYRKGLFNIELLTPVKSWIYNYSVQYENGKRLLKFIDESGKNLVFEFGNKEFTINEKEYKTNIEDEELFITIEGVNGEFKITMNGQTLNAKVVGFGNLKKIETSLTGDGVNRDKLYGATLISHD
jgi:hypothetical protein|tara:strand:+ start:3923 stop:4504 length:582 start_codon:yes stop_codon:yes gene_type:complete